MHTGNITSELFVPAQNEVYLLMEKDNFPRFKKSSLFKQLLNDIDPHYKVRTWIAPDQVIVKVLCSGGQSTT